MSSLRYPGGKTRAIPILETYILNDLKELYSPFFGGGSFELYIKKKFNIKVYANDKFEPLYNYWNCIKLNKAKLIEEVKKMHPLTKEQFIICKTNLTDITCDKFTRAACYFAINRSSFSGCTMSGGFSEVAANQRFTSSSIDRLDKTDLSNVEFTNQDFADFIKNIPNNSDKFIFLDPPYYLGKGSKLYGNKGDMHEKFDHEMLFDNLKNKDNYILCYNDCEYIRNLYKDYIIVSASWAYGMNNSKESSEIIIMSKKYAEKLKKQKEEIEQKSVINQTKTKKMVIVKGKK